MSLSTLPPEVLDIIIRKLDQRSVYNLYEADVLCLQGLVTECQFSVNTLATAKSLKTNFFLAVSPYLKVLNLCGVADLNLTSLTDALSITKHLIDLNVASTQIKTKDILEIVKVNPTLKSIAINFLFQDELLSQMNDDVLLEYQKAFEGFENVQFFGPIYTDPVGALAVRMLERADLRSLKLTSTGESSPDLDKRWNNMRMVKVSQLQVYFLQSFHTYTVFQPSIFDVMDFNKYEILIINANSDADPVRCYSAFATPLVKTVIGENFAVQVESLSDWPEVSMSEIRKRICPSRLRETAFMFWDKERTTFNEEFNKKVVAIFKKQFVFSLNSYDLKPVPPEFKWYSVKQSTPSDFNPKTNPVVELDYGSAFKEKEDVKLDIMFNFNLRGAVPRIFNNWDLLRKISHLFFYGRDVHFNLDFFNNLFENCHTLVTLQIVNKGDDRFHSEYLQLMPKCKTLKNIFIVAPIQFSGLFPYLSECRTLENICLNDFTFCKHIDINSIPDPSDLFSKCVNLYNLFMTFELSRSDSEKLERSYKKVQSDLGKDALNIRICYFRYGYIHPYTGVFSTYQLKPIM